MIPVALSPDGHWLANEVIAGGKLGLFDLNKLDEGATANISLSTPFSSSSEVLFSADSRWLMFSNDTQFSIWDVSKTRPDSAVLTIPMSLTRRRLSQDQQWLGLLDKSGKITIVNLSGNQAATQNLGLDAQGGYMDLAFSPDGRWFGAVDKTGNLSLYDLSNTGKQPLIPNRALNALTSLAFNLDENNMVVVGGTANGKVLLWNLSDLLNDPNSLPIVLQGGVKAYDQIVFTPDNNWLLAFGANEPLKAWRANFEDILKFACEGAGRNLSRSEWARYGFTEDYRATCTQWEIGK
jgi:WD40 repeat protein